MFHVKHSKSLGRNLLKSPPLLRLKPTESSPTGELLQGQKARTRSHMCELCWAVPSLAGSLIVQLPNNQLRHRCALVLLYRSRLIVQLPNNQLRLSLCQLQAVLATIHEKTSYGTARESQGCKPPLRGAGTYCCSRPTTVFMISKLACSIELAPSAGSAQARRS
jgi:hypothetical protein